MKPLYKTTIVIWSEYDGSEVELEDLARAATEGDAYCSDYYTEYVKDPTKDKNWDEVPERYTKAWYYDHTIHFMHINRRHALSPEGWVAMMTEERFALPPKEGE